MELLCIGLSLKHMFYHSCWCTLVFTEMLFPTANRLLSVEQKIKCCVLIYFVQIYKTSDGWLIQLDIHLSFWNRNRCQLKMDWIFRFDSTLTNLQFCFLHKIHLGYSYLQKLVWFLFSRNENKIQFQKIKMWRCHRSSINNRI